MNIHHADELLTEQETAKILNISKHTLSNWRLSHSGPLAFIKLGKLIRYSRKEICRFILSSTKMRVSK